jgi:hypothetical protein
MAQRNRNRDLCRRVRNSYLGELLSSCGLFSSPVSASKSYGRIWLQHSGTL